jgi:hypothetical protein
MQMSKWQKILLAVLGAAVAVAPIFIKNKDSQDKLKKIEEAAGGTLSSILNEG